jgi:hypothetical protein
MHLKNALRQIDTHSRNIHGGRSLFKNVSAARSLAPYRYELSRAIDVAILPGNQD